MAKFSQLGIGCGGPALAVVLDEMFKDASFLLTVEVFLLTVRLFTYGGGTVSKTDQTQFSGQGEP